MTPSEQRQPGKEDSLLCPSYLAKPGAQLFGLVNAEGRISYLRHPITIDATFVQAARAGRPAEERFRFAGKCIQNGCHQWSDAKQACALVDRLIDQMEKTAEASLPACPIRSRCRWFRQRGQTACAQCDEVIRHKEITFIDALSAP
ncbi:hypothetical protein LX87_04834 [Larkinella arboricola]|uniref:Nitrogen fixation protein n=1 Tax=Larkinella arboricola TaxID=643671 RepID=A0A327WNE4_LARAB|nr:hypothetical protein [Larkinella arboricola]RAJ92504.1 hypothetical protein LX87_04834 [Larkinella arboricola]